ncbi:MAG TPA: HAMP domain-containing sensor histidine kinase [Gemmatimonadaceae bacterium]
MRGASLSLRTKLVLIIVIGAMIPLGAVGAWLSSSTRRSAESLLRNRLDSAASHAVTELGSEWVAYRSVLTDIAEDSAVRRALGTHPSRVVHLDPHLRGGVERLRAATEVVFLLDFDRTPQWIVTADADGMPTLVEAKDSLRVMAVSDPDHLLFRLAIDGAPQVHAGFIDARFRLASLIPGPIGTSMGVGGLMAIVDRSTGRVSAPIPLDASALRRDRFTWGGNEWLAVSRQLTDPAIDVVVAAPVAAFMLPFERAARTGLVALIVVGVLGFVVAAMLTRQVTHSLVRLSDAATAVASGRLDERVDASENDEIGRLGAAFNSMTESLQRTLSALSERQAIAAVGEFASALAHEIRNPLSAIKLNLQYVEERLADAKLREPIRTTLRDIGRLDTTVAGALRLARTGRMPMSSVALDAIVASAARAALPDPAGRGLSLELGADRTTSGAHVIGNAAALEQLLLNLLLNAADATPSGGRIGVEIGADNGHVTIDVWDTGCGLAPDAAARAFEPFFTTKAEGTGLGLSIAKRIVDAHHGQMALCPREGGGTIVRVGLPVATHAA